MNQKKLSYLGLFAAVAIIFGYVESLIPFFAGIPGMKLGLANLAVLFILEKYTWKEAGTFDLRCHYRTSHRNADKRGTETYPLLNNTKNAEY